MKTRSIPNAAAAAALALLGTALGASPAPAEQLQLNATLGQPVVLAGERPTNYLKVGLTGFEFDKQLERPAANVAIVLDRSGSMQGEKLQQAKEAAKLAIDSLGKGDIVSLVTYDDTINVLVPATKVSDREAIKAKIDAIHTGGNTALFGGVSKGAAELRKFLEKDRVNRLILLSDGLANVGPSSPGELGELGESLLKEGIAVSTVGLGLGYNEDLMTTLAQKSDGNHYFAEEPADLAMIFKAELGSVLAVAAQDVKISIELADGMRPVRTLGRDAIIDGQTITASIQDVYSGQEKYVLVEIEVRPGKPDTSRPAGKVHVTYANMATGTREELSSAVEIRFTAHPDEVKKAEDRDTMVAAALMTAAELNKRAMILCDQGKTDEAKKILTTNAVNLKEQSVRWSSDALADYALSNKDDSENLTGSQLNITRKKAEAYQWSLQQQQELKPRAVPTSRDATNPPAPKAPPTKPNN
ncbi:MAG: VWA domain-containing protein [Verrucomicrobiales bacterium]